MQKPLQLFIENDLDTNELVEYVNLKLGYFPEYNIINTGGVITGGDNEIAFYGDTLVFYELEIPQEAHKFVDLRLNVISIEEAHQVRICLYESKKDALGQQEMVGEEFRCTEISTGNSKINTGALFEARTTSITHISLEQVNHIPSRNGNTIISSLALVTKEKLSIFDDTGECLDGKAMKIINKDSSEPQCFCEGNFVSSNGGKRIGELDSCVHCLLDTVTCARCLPEHHCLFESDACTYNRDCTMGSCQFGSCHAGVSDLDYFTKKTSFPLFSLAYAFAFHSLSSFSNKALTELWSKHPQLYILWNLLILGILMVVF